MVAASVSSSIASIRARAAPSVRSSSNCARHPAAPWKVSAEYNELEQSSIQALSASPPRRWKTRSSSVPYLSVTTFHPMS